MKNLYMMGLGLLFCMQALAQPFSISGRVLDAETQSPLEGVQIQEKGSRNGTFSDSEGKFSLKVSNARSVLLFSYAAYTQQQVALEGKKHLEIQLEPYAITSEEVVVTALGIEQEKKALGYAVQQLSAQELTEVRHTNLTNALAGRMAGVQSTYGASGPGASTHVFIRGETSLSGSNQPLFVLDGVPISNEVISNDTENLEGGFQEVDYGNGAGEISPDDVASITVLKGPAAAALYGSRAANGVVLIKTKDGLASRGLGISFHSSLSLETPVKFPQYQNVYGQGAGGQFAYEDGIGAGINDGGIRSFGPRMEGQLIPQFDSPSTDVNGHAVRGGDVIARQGNPITPTPFVPHPDNVRDFFRTGLTLQNHLALSAAQPGGAFRLSYSRLDNEGMVPNAGLRRNSLALSGHQALNHRLSMRAFLNYIQSASNHRPAIGYGSENPMYLFTWMGRQVDTRSLKDYWQAGQQGFQQFNYNYLWMDNPYLAVFENTNAFEKNRVLGNVQINLQLTPQLDLRFRTGMDEYSDLRSSRRAKSTQRFKHGAYREDEVHFREINADFQLTYHTLLGKQWRTNFSLGGNWMDQQSAYKSTVAGELSVPGIYNFGNAKIPLVVKQQQAGRRIYSLYGISRLSYGQGLFLDFTFRNDWSSVLPAANRSFAYYSTAAGILLSSFFELPKSIDLLKLRLSSASAGNDTDPFQLKNTFVFNENYATYPLLSSDTRLLNARLKPERLNALETGIELWMFKQRIGLDVSIYQNTSIHQIIRLPTSAASGYTQRVINGGKIRSRGLEAVLNLQPVRNSWNWHLYANFSLNRSRVVQL
ncbi:MAG: SusC/RagA family TonB-linked outer membrane protein, partial [Bacteroidetes bacterium]